MLDLPALPREELWELKVPKNRFCERAWPTIAGSSISLRRLSINRTSGSLFVEKQQEEEEQGSRADTVELRRLVDLLSKETGTNPRITDARRALLLSSTRALQVNAELLELKRQKAESARAVQRFEDEQRVSLLKELQDAASAKAVSRIKIESS